MAMSAEHAKSLKNEYAVVCCRTEEGTIICAENLEDPEIFPDLLDSGLLEIPQNSLKIGQVIGAKLTKTIDSLTPITAHMVEGIKEEVLEEEDKKAVLKYNKKAGHVIKASDLENPMHFEKLEDSLLIKLSEHVLTRKEVVGKKLVVDAPALTPIKAQMLEGFKVEETAQMKKESYNPLVQGGILKIQIDEGRGINIEIPVGSLGQGQAQLVEVPQQKEVATEKVQAVEHIVEEVKVEDKLIRKLVRKHIKIEDVKFGEVTKFDGKTLYIRENICHDAAMVSEIVKDIKVEIITPDKYNTYSETIMDVQPIATKDGDHELGSGATRLLDGAIIMVTGTDEDGVQIGEFGSSEGILEENIQWGRPGAPDKGEIFIKSEVVIARGTNMERPGPLAAHKATDYITQEIREAMKKLDESYIDYEEEFVQYRRPGKKKVVLVKEIMGQGAMHDNLILPVEPVGVLGGKPNVDLGNVPVVLSPLEVLDGGIHALVCIGPASKECSRHYFREPLVIETMNDPQLDLCGVIFVGSPQINSEKFYVSKRLGMMVETMDVDGVIVTTEGFGNNHIDFASHIEQIGMRNIPVVGMSFCAVQGALVVGNKYMKYMVDNNKSEAGIENEVLSCNTLCKEDALRALGMLKTAMGDGEIKAPERKWNPNVKETNLELVEKAYGIEIERVENETSIPMSEKRLEKYSTK
ncbi:MAG: D-proline reductase (dithiol) proprotein PrdA [Anaeromicrobium sp.]|jgi:D-proline reductase (dithiol) PrdA|uniref:D-proline reductase (dithiol) proprotein PrdA n=1 Tax=Anaeromicrobium sp. TaxID=1929132 RepID=UPI0025FA7A2D|nr:D-proline reductase (dithiol) proprotein PrdA [Anaeromicrobium sp.]MCT4593623.1 D-proline reductase (dithiol) proprotein PrdA [Anaeromicrobium sp.]